MLMNSLEEESMTYLQNYLNDFLNLIETTFENFFGIWKPSNISKERKIELDIKVHHKREKNRAQVVMKSLED